MECLKSNLIMIILKKLRTAYSKEKYYLDDDDK